MTVTPPPVVRLDGSRPLSAAEVGGKGSSINTIRRHGLPTPAAFCVTLPFGREHLAGSTPLSAIWDQVVRELGWLEETTASRFGDPEIPLLLSVRGGAERSMPGMLETILNVGLTPGVHRAMITRYGRGVGDSLRRELDGHRNSFPGSVIPSGATAQLRGAMGAVLRSWRNPAAVAYRRHHGLDEDAGTAVVVQAMALGNIGHTSGSGVVFSESPIAGSGEPFGEWLPAQQGSALVSGNTDGRSLTGLARVQPRIYRQLIDATETLRRSQGAPVEVEFTIEAGRLWILQCRTAIQVAIGSERHPPTLGGEELLAAGTPACPGVATGRAYTDADAALAAADRGEDVVLIRETTSPTDVAAILAARAVATEIGGATSHAAVISREAGLPAVVGCGAGLIESAAGRVVTVDGTAGEVRVARRSPQHGHRGGPGAGIRAGDRCG